ncbi:MAG: hypothetical protein J6D45_02510, partial [Clostridia bacterium]|nr:hypothetical protein [Clostridia bacterium]
MSGVNMIFSPSAADISFFGSPSNGALFSFSDVVSVIGIIGDFLVSRVAMCIAIIFSVVFTLVLMSAVKNRLLIGNVFYLSSGRGKGSDKAQRKQGRNRFYKLNEVDDKMKKYATPEAEKGLTLEEMCERFRNFAAT